jgi:tRNA dimethylallyltransferase
MGEGELRPVLVAIMGPTASGKTELAEALAERLSAQLVNADAFQIYRGMDIGTAKPLRKSEYRLLDIRNPSEGFGVGEYVALANGMLRECWELGKSVVVVGGTGLYIRALIEEYDDMAQAPDPELRTRLNQKSLEELLKELKCVDESIANRIDLHNRVRVQRALERIYSPKPSEPVRLPPFEKHKFAVVRESGETSDRITRRVEDMVQNGWIGEVQQLAAAGYTESDPGLRALGYRAIWRHLNGEVELKEALATTIAETRQYAKRQRTWLRSEPNLVVLESGDALAHASRVLSGYLF